MKRRTFMSRANRDAAWRQGGKRGTRSSIRNQQLHPQYVEDYAKETGETLTAADCGFGNTIYKTSFGVLYILGEDRLENMWAGRPMD
jgi:hypothetical protein